MRPRVALYTQNSMVGGSELFFSSLCAELADREIAVHAISPAGVVADFLHEQLGEVATVHELPAIRSADASFKQQLARLAEPWWEVRKLLRQIGPDVFHINNGGYPASDPCRIATFSTRVPRVMSVHATPTAYVNHRPAIERAVDRRIWGSLSAVLSATRITAEQLHEVRGMPRGLARVVPYGVPPHTVDPAAVASLRKELAPNDELLVGMVCSAGSSTEWKGYPVLAEALAATESQSVKAILIGHDPGDGFWKQADVLGVRNRIVFAGRVDDVRAYMAAFDATAIPSVRFESLPLVLLESLSVGTPVLGSRLAGIPEAVTDNENGFLFTPGDARELAGLFDRAASDRNLLTAMRPAAKRRFESEFSLRQTVDKTLSVYADIAGIAPG